MNPFAQWCISDDSTTIPPISIFGALPQPFPPPPCSFVEFHFTSFNPTILDSVVIGPNNQPCYFVSTDPSGFTVIQDRHGMNVSFIEWQTHPIVEIQDRLARQTVENWLRISRDQQTRLMDYRKTRYSWSTYNQHICVSISFARYGFTLFLPSPFPVVRRRYTDTKPKGKDLKSPRSSHPRSQQSRIADRLAGSILDCYSLTAMRP
jgi:hypothetical protein